MDHKILILTGKKKFFGQTRKPWVSMDVERICSELKKYGYDTEVHPFYEVVNQTEPLNDRIIFYSFSQRDNERQYIRDLIYYLDNGTNLIIPCYELLKCHENKGYQELYRKTLELEGPESLYFSSYKEMEGYELNFPLILKSTSGSNGQGVYRAENRKELIKLIKQLRKQNLLTQLDLIRRRYFRREKQYPHYPDYSNATDYQQYRDYVRREQNFVLQEFIPGLEFDYRVLIIFDRYYVGKRFTRPGEFRASGAKLYNFKHEDIPSGLLDYAESVYNKFDTPFLSIDIGCREDKYYLFEFQVLHFGLNVIIKNKGYFLRKEDNWELITAENRIEQEIAYGLSRFLNEKLKVNEAV
ncbi:MAG: hypothetical protein WAN36_10975 [Calditrichia bacterium]